MTHEMHLHCEPFLKILSGQKNIEVRVNDEKRQKLKVGDQIIFTERGGHSSTVLVEVTSLQHGENFLELFRMLNAEDTEEVLSEKMASIHQYYSHEDEEKYGVVGICFQVK